MRNTGLDREQWMNYPVSDIEVMTPSMVTFATPLPEFRCKDHDDEKGEQSPAKMFFHLCSSPKET